MTFATALGAPRNPVGINPIGWSNDDFHDLGGEITLERCLTEMKQAGFEGAELGHKFPREAGALSQVLGGHGLRLVSGWHSTYLATADFDAQLRDFTAHLKLLKNCGSNVAIVAECSYCVHGDPNSALDFITGRPVLTAAEWKKVHAGLEAFAQTGAAEGIQVVYHHHMGTVVQQEAELNALLAAAPSLKLLYDTGHLRFAGIDYLSILKRYKQRVGHVHLKNVRPAVAAEARAKGWSFATAVRNGVFTVCGDPEGAVDFALVFTELRSVGYSGWLVVEAEQDPAKANPLRYATLARDYIREHAGS